MGEDEATGEEEATSEDDSQKMLLRLQTALAKMKEANVVAEAVESGYTLIYRPRAPGAAVKGDYQVTAIGCHLCDQWRTFVAIFWDRLMLPCGRPSKTVRTPLESATPRPWRDGAAYSELWECTLQLLQRRLHPVELKPPHLQKIQSQVPRSQRDLITMRRILGVAASAHVAAAARAAPTERRMVNQVLSHLRGSLLLLSLQNRSGLMIAKRQRRKLRLPICNRSSRLLQCSETIVELKATQSYAGNAIEELETAKRKISELEGELISAKRSKDEQKAELKSDIEKANDRALEAYGRGYAKGQTNAKETMQEAMRRAAA